ncbi:MAG TPA: hypothetical protein VFJ74_14810 [Gemmatimonadaceae bacterium]|nr:hypothetical protein [Gemmatimonadaceae bacterium]
MPPADAALRPSPAAGGRAPSPRDPRRAARATATLAALGAALLVAVACTGDRKPAARGDSVGAGPPPADSAAVPAAAPAALGWSDTAAGPALFIPAQNAGSTQLVFPTFTDSTLTDSSKFDLGSVRGARVDLFTRSGAVGSAPLGSDPAAPSREEECTSWPTARLATAPGTWAVGFAAGHATAIPLDSIEGLAPTDSARLAADVARLASALPNDTAPAFRGLPFTVRTVRRFSPAPGVQALVADVRRKVNQEANPREEHILLVAERDSAQPASPWTAAYAERVADNEETIESSDVLAAVALGPRRVPTLVIGREYGEGFAYALLERAGPKKWRLRWSSAYAGC